MLSPNYKKGIKAILAAALISGAANFLNKEVISAGVSPVLLVLLKNSLAGLLFIFLTLFFIKSGKISWPDKKSSWLKLILLAVVGGSVPFILFFKGLAITSAINGSFIHKTMFVWAALFSLVFLKEKLRGYQFLGLGIMFLGVLSAISFNLFDWGRGELMIFAATLFWSAEMIMVKKFIVSIDYRLLAAARMALGAILVFIYTWQSGSLSLLSALTSHDWLGIFIVSCFLFGYVFFWYRALSFLPAGLTASILTLAFPITIILSNLKVLKWPSFADLGFIFLLAAGVILLIQALFKKPCPATSPI